MGEMTTTLLGLGSDILLLHVFNYLDWHELAILGQTCPEMQELVADPSVWHALYTRTFPDPPLSGKAEPWEVQFANRSHAELRTWGNPRGGRLGYQWMQAPESHRRGMFAVHRPVKVGLPAQIRSLACGGYSIVALTMDGKLWALGQGRGNSYQPFLEMPAKERIIAISGGRDQILATGISGSVYMYKQSMSEPYCRLQFSFFDQVIKVVAGWDKNAAIVNNIGLLLWRLNGEPAFMNGEYILAVDDSLVIPFTKNTDDDQWTVVDMAVGQSFVVFISGNGHLFGCKTETRNNRLSFTPQYLEEVHNKIPSGVFVHVRAAMSRFIALTSTGQIVQVNWKDELQATVIEEPTDVVQVSLGDHHNLARTASGELYSWGVESQCCGSLGLGPPNEIEAKGGRLRQLNIRLADAVMDRPVKVAEQVYHIAAGGWQSTALFP